MVAQLSLKPKRSLTISQAAQFLGVTPVIIRYWEKKGYDLAIRTEGGIRKYKPSVLKAFILAHPELISKTQDPEKSSIKKLQGHFLVTTRFAILTSLTILVFGVAIGLNSQYLLKLINSAPNNANLLDIQQPSSAPIKAEFVQKQFAAQKDNLSQGLPEVKSFETTGILVNISGNETNLSDPADIDENDLDIKTPMPLLTDQEINCTLI